jgi:hypothetical protein
MMPYTDLAVKGLTKESGGITLWDMRAQRTDKDMEVSGQWGKAGKRGGKQVWRHASGVEVSWNCNAWGWQISDQPGRLFPALWAARVTVEAAAAKSAA